MASQPAAFPELDAELDRHAHETADTLERLKTRLRGDFNLREQLLRRPNLLLGVALTAGFVLGRGLRNIMR